MSLGIIVFFVLSFGFIYTLYYLFFIVSYMDLFYREGKRRKKKKIKITGKKKSKLKKTREIKEVE